MERKLIWVTGHLTCLLGCVVMQKQLSGEGKCTAQNLSILPILRQLWVMDNFLIMYQAIPVVSRECEFVKIL
jgi:hypothetical protein